jgi:hypothetical protein
MNITIQSTKNEKAIRASTICVKGSDGTEWIALDLDVSGGRARDQVGFYLPISEKAIVEEIASLWNTLSVAKVQS